jgi:peptidoglycan/LPS O-acetylase OafA/YrhL
MCDGGLAILRYEVQVQPPTPFPLIELVTKPEGSADTVSLWTGAKLSFSLFITHAITGLVWFGVTDILTARLDLPVAVQWVLWGLSVPAALLFAGLFHVLVDGPLQAWIARRLKARRPAASQLPA